MYFVRYTETQNPTVVFSIYTKIHYKILQKYPYEGLFGFVFGIFSKTINSSDISFYLTEVYVQLLVRFYGKFNSSIPNGNPCYSVQY